MTKQKKTVLAFGEVMLRIALANYQTIEQTKEAKLNFTGTGLNVLSGVAHFGYHTQLLTQLPNNRVGTAAKSEMRKLGISDELIKEGGEHIGVYLLEQGFGNRASEVTYLDRRHSAFGQSQWQESEIIAAVSSTDIIHICGISLALTEQTKQAVFMLAMEGKRQGKKICFDFNFRPSIAGNQDLAALRADYEKVLHLSDIVIGGQRDLVELLQLDRDRQSNDFAVLSRYFVEKYQIEIFAGTTRVMNGHQRYLKGFVINRIEATETVEYPVYIFDRVGTGDAFASGVIASYIEGKTSQEMVDFATASAVLAHTTLGDSPVLSEYHINQFLENPTLDIIR